MDGERDNGGYWRGWIIAIRQNDRIFRLLIINKMREKKLMRVYCNWVLM